jgi:hypothetical protein
MRKFATVKLKLILLASALSIALSPGQSFGWGRQGHAAIIRLAFQLMPAEQRDRIYTILLGETDPWKIGNWADEVGRSEYPYSKPWHYVDIPTDASRYVPQRDCKKGCLISELSRLDKEWKSRSMEKEDMLFYLHFLGDLYQPFHDIGPTGANDIHVIFDGESRNLHWVWDDGIVRDHGIDTESLLRIARKMRSQPMEMDVQAIAMQEHDIARANMEEPDATLPADYSAKHWPTVERALVMAALQIVARTKDM